MLQDMLLHILVFFKKKKIHDLVFNMRTWSIYKEIGREIECESSMNSIFSALPIGDLRQRVGRRPKNCGMNSLWRRRFWPCNCKTCKYHPEWLSHEPTRTGDAGNMRSQHPTTRLPKPDRSFRPFTFDPPFGGMECSRLQREKEKTGKRQRAHGWLRSQGCRDPRFSRPWLDLMTEEESDGGGQRAVEATSERARDIKRWLLDPTARPLFRRVNHGMETSVRTERRTWTREREREKENLKEDRLTRGRNAQRTWTVG